MTFRKARDLPDVVSASTRVEKFLVIRRGLAYATTCTDAAHG
jgi:hypothetical protein